MSVREQPIGVLIAGIGCILGLMLGLLYLTFSLDANLSETQERFHTLHRKTELAYAMREAIRKRSMSLAIVTNIDDYFERDTEQQRFFDAAREFVLAREELLSLGISSIEQSFLHGFENAVRGWRPFVDKAMNKLVKGLPAQEAEALALKAIHIQTKQFSRIDQFVKQLEKLGADQLVSIEKENDQKRQWVLFLSSLIFLSGVSIAFLIIVRERNHLRSLRTEINERKNAEESVRELNTLLEKRVEERTRDLNRSRDALLEAQRVAAIGSWEWLVQENKIIWSAETFHLFGIHSDKGEPNFEEFLDRVHPDDRDFVQEAVAESLRDKLPYNVQFRIIRTNGKILTAHAIGKLETNAEGVPIRLYGTFQDISEQKKSEELLRKLSRAVEQSPSSVFITNTEGIIEYVNAKFTEMMGYTLEEAVGQTPRILKSDDTPKAVYAELWNTILSGQEWRGEIVDQHKDGSTFWAYVTVAPVKDDKGIVTHFIAMHENISQRKQAEEGMRKALEAADIANRSKSELLANMSHELRTPLNAIIGFSSSMREETFGPLGHQKYKEYLEDIAHSGNHLLELISDILDVSAIEAGKVVISRERLKLAEIISASVRLIEGRYKDWNIGLSTNVEEDLPEIIADKRRLKQILINLLSNAGKFTESGGQVTINATGDGENGHLITVIDTGIGLNDDELGKAMSKFGQVDRGITSKHEGTGLGLPLTKMLVEIHGGTLKIESIKGFGTTVTLHFPAQFTL